MSVERMLVAEARRVAQLLKKRDLKIVFAESCTGGLISATLTRIPGISACHCGSAVVYQLQTKAAWLEIPANMLEDPGPVSPEVARAMAEAVLKITPQANLAAAVTGHLGPDAPADLDGLIYAAVAQRPEESRAVFETIVRKHRLTTHDKPKGDETAESLRVERQISAAGFVFSLVISVLESA